MLSLLIRGAVAGAALLGLLVALLGGASVSLVLVFFGFGVLGVLTKDASVAWARRRNLLPQE